MRPKAVPIPILQNRLVLCRFYQNIVAHDYPLGVFDGCEASELQGSRKLSFEDFLEDCGHGNLAAGFKQFGINTVENRGRGGRSTCEIGARVRILSGGCRSIPKPTAGRKKDKGQDQYDQYIILPTATPIGPEDGSAHASPQTSKKV